MELQIVSKTENPLFNRTEIEATIEAEITPSHAEVKDLLSKKFSTEYENIKVKTIQGRFGSKIFIVVANIYKSKKEKDRIELKKKREIESEKKLEMIKEKKSEIQEVKNKEE